MLGYWPESSVCAIFVDADERVVVIMRWDHDVHATLPPRHHIAAGDTPVEAVHLVVFPPLGDLDVAPWLAAADSLEAAGVHLDRFLLAGKVDAGIAWTSARQPPDDPTVAFIGHAEIAATVREWGMSPWRERRADYVGDIAPRPDASVRVSEALSQVAPLGEKERDAAIADARRRLACQDLTPSEIAQTLIGLGDVHVRDTLLWDLMQEKSSTWGWVADRLAAIVAAAPDSHVAPPATLLAILRWQMGDGSRAVAAVERALAADPTYSLAILVDRCLVTGLHPGTWRDGLATLSRADCRRSA
jgi:hypothetical protein